MKKIVTIMALFATSAFAQDDLIYKGKKLSVSEDTMFSAKVKEFKVGNNEVALFSESSGGTACPATYFFASVEQGKLKQTLSFGTCSDLAKTSQKNNQIIVSMPNMDRKGQTVYVYENGSLTENGKVIR